MACFSFESFSFSIKSVFLLI
jgi:hypothetical protein